MLTYTIHPELTRDAMIAATQEHRAADRYVSGTYWRGGRGCAVGCAIETVRQRTGLNIRHNDHVGLAAALGWPEWLAHLEDVIFEGLSADRRSDWPSALVTAVPQGADLSGVRDQWLALVLRRVVLPVAGTSAAVVARVALGLETQWHDDSVGAASNDASLAARAAASHDEASWAAAWAAANAAGADVAWAATNATRAAGAAARAAWAMMSELLLDCLRAAPGPKG